MMTTEEIKEIEIEEADKSDEDARYDQYRKITAGKTGNPDVIFEALDLK